MKNKVKAGRIIGNTALIILLIFSILIFIFALLSGSETYGGGISGIIKNSPNAIPWAILLVIVYVAHRWKLIGGILVTLMGFGFLYFFVFSGTNFMWASFVIALIPVILGGLILLSWGLLYGEKKHQNLSDLLNS